jgi:hypothetical protein
MPMPTQTKKRLRRITEIDDRAMPIARASSAEEPRRTVAIQRIENGNALSHTTPTLDIDSRAETPISMRTAETSSNEEENRILDGSQGHLVVSFP